MTSDDNNCSGVKYHMLVSMTKTKTTIELFTPGSSLTVTDIICESDTGS